MMESPSANEWTAVYYVQCPYCTVDTWLLLDPQGPVIGDLCSIPFISICPQCGNECRITTLTKGWSSRADLERGWTAMRPGPR